MIHLVYPHKNLISAPNVIGWRIYEYLSKNNEVIAHNWDAMYVIEPSLGDVLIGHAHPLSHTVFRRSMMSSKWSRKILIQPYNGAVENVGYIDDVIDFCDLFLTITGSFWFNKVQSSAFARWYPKMIHMDLAIDSSHFPKIINQFHKPGHRRFLYIGNDHPAKNMKYLNAISMGLKPNKIDWFGKGKNYSSIHRLGWIDFSTPLGQRLIANYDFLITVGKADANPTTILEAMSWGLIPICTPESGYENIKGIVNVPLDDVNNTLAILNRLQYADDKQLLELQAIGRSNIKENFSWDRFLNNVQYAIFNNNSPAIETENKIVQNRNIMSNLILTIKVLVNNIKYFLKKHT